MAPCFIGDAGCYTIAAGGCSVFLAWLLCSFLLLVFVAVWPALSWLCPPSPSLLVGPLPSGPVSALLVLRASGCICNCISWSITARSIALALASTRMRKLWYGVLWLIGSCLHSSSWQQRLRPVLCGLCALHHVGGAAQVPLALALRFSPLGDPEPSGHR